MPIISPSEAAEKHNRRTKASIEDYKSGVSRVTESPTAKAAASEDKWKAGVERAAQKGKFKSGLLRVSLDEWKRKTLNKGAGRIASGVDEARGKVESFFQDFLPHVEQLQTKLAGMPSNTIEDSIARATESIRHNASFSRSA